MNCFYAISLPPLFFAVLFFGACVFLFTIWKESRKGKTSDKQKNSQQKTDVEYVIIPGEDNWKNHYQPKE